MTERPGGRKRERARAGLIEYPCPAGGTREREGVRARGQRAAEVNRTVVRERIESLSATDAERGARVDGVTGGVILETSVARSRERAGRHHGGARIRIGAGQRQRAVTRLGEPAGSIRRQADRADGGRRRGSAAQKGHRQGIARAVTTTGVGDDDTGHLAAADGRNCRGAGTGAAADDDGGGARIVRATGGNRHGA